MVLLDSDRITRAPSYSGSHLREWKSMSSTRLLLSLAGRSSAVRLSVPLVLPAISTEMAW